MIAETYQTIVYEVEAVRVTEENLYSVAIWTKGVIKGTAYPKSKQCVGFFNKELQEEIIVRVGDYLVRKDKAFEVMNETQFNKNYRKVEK